MKSLILITLLGAYSPVFSKEGTSTGNGPRQGHKTYLCEFSGVEVEIKDTEDVRKILHDSTITLDEFLIEYSGVCQETDFY